MARLDYKTDEGQKADDRLNPEMLRRAEAQSHFNREFDSIVGNMNQTADDSDENANIKKAKDLEQAGSGFKVNADSIKQAATDRIKGGGKGKINFQKAMPVGTMVAIVFGAGGAMTFLPLGIPLISLQQNATDARANASRVQAVRYKSTLRYMIGNKQVTAACEKNPSGPACKLGTMSDKQRKMYEANGFKVNAEAAGDRHIIKSIVAPDGTVMDSGDKFFKKMATDIKLSLAAQRAHNARNLVLNGGRALKKVLLPLGINKAPVEKLPEKEEDRHKALNKIMGLKEDGKVDEDKLLNTVEGKAKTGIGTDTVDEGTGKFKSKLAKGPAAVLGTLCMTYDSLSLVVNLSKLTRYAQFAVAASPYLKIASDIRLGIADPTTVSALANQVTATDKNGLSALDAQGIKLLFGSDEKGLANYTKDFFLYDNAFLKKANGSLEAIDGALQKHGKLGYKSARPMCRVINSAIGTALGSAACFAIAAIQTGGGAAAGTIVPVIGNLVGGLAGGFAGIAECLAIIAFSFIGDFAVGKLMNELVVPWVMKAAIQGIPNANTVGPPLGQMISVGAAVAMNGINRTNGLVPATKRSLLSRSPAVGQEEALYKQLEIAKARDTPFDIYNRYSFLGSIVSSMNTQVFTAESRMSSGNLAFQRLFGAFSLAPSALAVGESSSPITARDLSAENCHDALLKAMGAVCDIDGFVSYTMSPLALSMEILPNLNYMNSNGYIDESGAPVDDKDYARFVKWCAERESEIGITTEPISSPDYEWATGERCYDENTKMDNFQAYYASMAANEDSEYSEATAGGGSGGGNVSAMSYNILGQSHSNDGGLSIKHRMDAANQTILAEQPDVIGFQEVSDMRDDLDAKLSGTYDSYPNKGDGTKDGIARPIYWNKTKYTVAEKGVFTTPRYSNDTTRFPYVKLKNSSGGAFYVFNMHASANCCKTPGYSRSEARAKNTKDMIKAIKEKLAADPDTPVIMTGDYNSTCKKTNHDGNISEDQIPCKLLYAAGFADAGIEAKKAGAVENYQYSTSHGSAGKARKTKKSGEGRHIDHVFYSSSNVSVTSWKNVITEQSKDASDHTPVVAKLSIKGMGDEEDDGSATTTDFKWPFGESHYKKNKADYLGAHMAKAGDGTYSGTAWGSAASPPQGKGGGIATDIGTVPTGMLVHAMFGGKVTSTSLCGSNDGIAIESKIGGGTVKIAYMHGSNKRFRVGQTVKAGDVIMNVGELGCTVRGAHLHLGILYNDRYVCPQDIFLAAEKGQSFNFSALVKKGKRWCGR